MKLTRIGAAIAVMTYANIVINPAALAAVDDQSRDSNSKIIAKELEELRNELENAKADDGTSSDKLPLNAKPREFGFSDDKMFSQSELKGEVRKIQFPAGSIRQLKFSSRLSRDDIQIDRSQDDLITVQISILADPEHNHLIAGLRGSVEVSMDGDRVSVDERNQRYSCLSNAINGVLSLKGACYSSITVSLPESSSISVYNGKGRIHGPAQPMTVRQLIDDLADGTPRAKLGKIDEFAGMVPLGAEISSSDMEIILRKFSFDDDKLKALEKLVYLLNRAEREKLSTSISSIFTFDSEQEQAYRSLLIGH